MLSKNKKLLFYAFVLINIAILIYIYAKGEMFDLEKLKFFLSGQNFLLSYLIYIAILIIRGLTLIPGTAFLLIGIYLFSVFEVFLAIQIAIICYCFIIYNFAHRLNFKVPPKILSYEQKIKSKEIPIIFALCFIPGISINVLIYFLSIININIKTTLIGIIAGTSITSIVYILIIKGIIDGTDYFLNYLNFLNFL